MGGQIRCEARRCRRGDRDALGSEIKASKVEERDVPFPTHGSGVAMYAPPAAQRGPGQSPPKTGLGAFWVHFELF